MQVTAEMVSTLGGAFLPLDQRIADALMNYAKQASEAAGVPPQTWVRKTWGMADYEAKDLLKGRASKTHYERILKLRGPDRGWHVGLAVTGAVVGQPLHEFFREVNERAAREAAYALEDERQARAAYRALESASARSGRSRSARSVAGEVGADQARRVAGRSE